MRERFEEFMKDRYGTDALSKFMLGAGVVIMLLNLLVRIPLLNTLVLVLFILVYVRMFSKNISARYEENMKYLDTVGRVKEFFASKFHVNEEMKNYHIYRCPKCHQKIRIPRGKGRIMITCPRCRNEFEKNS